MLWHYNEIGTEQTEDFIVNQIPEYLFTWAPGDIWITMWVTNNVSKREESFYKFVRTLDLELAQEMLNLKGHYTLEPADIKRLIQIFTQEIYATKMRGELPTEYLFNN